MEQTTPDPRQENYRRAVNYLVAVLRKNPLEESAGIIAGRNKLLGLKEAASDSAGTAALVERRQRREATLAAIEGVRANFWAAPLADLQGALAKLDASDFPDLQATIYRLNTVAGYRSRFPALTQRREFDAAFFSVFKDVLVSPPKEVAIAKERMLASFSTAKNRRRGQRMIKLIQREMPDIYNLEASWLDTLSRQSRSTTRAIAAPVQRAVRTSGGSGVPWWLIPIGLAIVRALMSLGKH